MTPVTGPARRYSEEEGGVGARGGRSQGSAAASQYRSEGICHSGRPKCRLSRQMYKKLEQILGCRQVLKS